jgi:hypothetical protein
VDLLMGRARGQGRDSLSGFERVYGSPFGDTLKASVGMDDVSGLSGPDRVHAVGATTQQGAYGQ